MFYAETSVCIADLPSGVAKMRKVGARALELRPWLRINTFYPVIQKRVFKQKFRSKYA